LEADPISSGWTWQTPVEKELLTQKSPWLIRPQGALETHPIAEGFTQPEGLFARLRLGERDRRGQPDVQPLLRTTRREIFKGPYPGLAHPLAEGLGGAVIGRIEQGGARRCEGGRLQAQAPFHAVARLEGVVRGADAAAGRRHFHAFPEQQTVVGGFRHGGGQLSGAIEQTGLVATAEARAPAQRRIAERCAQQIVQRFTVRRQRRLAGFQQFLEQALLLEVVHQLLGGDLFLAFHQADQSAAQRLDLLLARAGRPDVLHQMRPRMASRYSATRTRPWTCSISSSGTPPRWRLDVRRKCRMSASSPPNR